MKPPKPPKHMSNEQLFNDGLALANELRLVYGLHILLCKSVVESNKLSEDDPVVIEARNGLWQTLGRPAGIRAAADLREQGVFIPPGKRRPS